MFRSLQLIQTGHKPIEFSTSFYRPCMYVKGQRRNMIPLWQGQENWMTLLNLCSCVLLTDLPKGKEQY